MTAPRDKHDDGSTRIGDDSATARHARTDNASGTHTGAAVHNRMSGTHDDRHERVEHRTIPEKIKSAKTSAAATFGLVFGLAALFCALTAILSPAAVLFGLIGLVLSIVGMKMAKRVGVTGKGVAIGGLVTSLLGLLLGAAVLAGAAAVVNDEQQLNRLENWIQDARNDLPSTQDLREELPN